MDETADEIIAREKALADFDHARDDFEDAFSRVPDEALDYMPDGDTYTILGLVPHITGSMKQYSNVVELMHKAAFGEVRANNDAAPETEGDQTSDRVTALTEMESAHDTLAGRLRELAYEDFTRKAPVYYHGSTEAYPTSAEDIIGWVTGHYREHIPHLAELMETWNKTK